MTKTTAFLGTLLLMSMCATVPEEGYVPEGDQPPARSDVTTSREKK